MAMAHMDTHMIRNGVQSACYLYYKKKTSYLTHFIKINSLGTAAPVIQIADDVEHGLLPEKHAGHVTKIKHGLRKGNTLILEEIIFGGCPAIEQRKGDREEGQRFPQHV